MQCHDQWECVAFGLVQGELARAAFCRSLDGAIFLLVLIRNDLQLPFASGQPFWLYVIVCSVPFTLLHACLLLLLPFTHTQHARPHFAAPPTFNRPTLSGWKSHVERVNDCSDVYKIGHIPTCSAISIRIQLQATHRLVPGKSAEKLSQPMARPRHHPSMLSRAYIERRQPNSRQQQPSPTISRNKNSYKHSNIHLQRFRHRIARISGGGGVQKGVAI